MPSLSSIAKKIQFAEGLVPPRWRLPVRYHGQRLVGGLEPEMALLADLVKPSDVALDIGANRGVYAYALANIAAAVHCFEPLSECCRYIEEYRSGKITVHNVALSDQAGVLQLHIPVVHGRPVLTRASLDRPAGEFEVRDIEVRTLDSFSFPRVDFIKIDVEGLEAAVLRGAKSTLRRQRPGLLVEIDRDRHSRQSFEAVIKLLETSNYLPYICSKGVLVPCDEPWQASADRVNFIFLPCNGTR